jgi:hypothetical protein
METIFGAKDTDVIILTATDLQPFSKCVQDAVNSQIPIVLLDGSTLTIDVATVESRGGISFIDATKRLPWKF